MSFAARRLLHCWHRNLFLRLLSGDHQTSSQGEYAVDVLDDVLDTLDLKGALYFRTHFSPPWAVAVPELGSAARFHLVVQGRCHVTVDSGAEETLGPGDVVLIPRGHSHSLADAPGRPAPRLEQVLDEAGYDGRGVLVVGDGDPRASTQLICGHYDFRAGADHPLLRALPDHLVITAGARAEDPWLDDLLRLMTRRLFSGAVGSPGAVTRLSEVVFVELLRGGIAQCEALGNVLEAFGDRYVGRALELIHVKPAQSWTVESLASRVGMSRSRFAERFKQLVGVGPMAYLADWRLQKALGLLETPRASIKQVANDTGWGSPAAFSRAFSDRFGVSPREYRRTAA